MIALARSTRAGSATAATIPVEHEFRYPLFMAYLDLDELPWVLDPYPGLVGPAAGARAFKRADYLGDRGPAAGRVRSGGGGRARRRASPTGPIRLLTNLRYFGPRVQPGHPSTTASTTADERVDSVLAEVTNTPWGERHSYLLGGDGGRGA